MGRLTNQERGLHGLGVVLVETVSQMPKDDPIAVEFLQRLLDVAKSSWPPLSNSYFEVLKLVEDAQSPPF
jgi:hypothetical protein